MLCSLLFVTFCLLESPLSFYCQRGSLYTFWIPLCLFSFCVCLRSGWTPSLKALEHCLPALMCTMLSYPVLSCLSLFLTALFCLPWLCPVLSCSVCIMSSFATSCFSFPLPCPALPAPAVHSLPEPSLVRTCCVLLVFALPLPAQSCSLT